ncbi:transcriptional regulator, TetR family [Saccharopolyspora kobensis]|uniref:Transcriptional regulator, TetR family n=2 Tax=Saccharopolyspora kobensis TaxID=146035 RepID=A0A1H6DVL2_9PSEU|nr:transcriptional regulator, TetR family [Saccharopolyspora kobensis]SFD98750.1 transcriptional regulator, TetR family [Saccharopolyspora kobensis]
MSPEERRAMIITVAIPLVAEYGAAVTTKQVARAAGIGEATIFRVFEDKDELISACMEEALRPDQVTREIASISLDDPLADRLRAAADALAAHLERIGTLAGALHATGHPSGARNAMAGKLRTKRAKRPGSAEQGSESAEQRPGPAEREGGHQVRDAVAELFEPERDSLRLPPDKLTAMFLGFLYTRGRMGGESAGVEPAELVDLFLHGALAEAK